MGFASPPTGTTREERDMPKAKLTKRVVESAQPRATDFVIWDTDLARFGLKVSAGGHKTFIIKY